MKINNHYFHLLLASICCIIANFCWLKVIAQSPTVLLEERFAVNKNHPYFKDFIMAEKAYSREFFYYSNLGCAGKTRQKQGGPLVTNKGSENSLIYTLQFEDRVEYDTLQNCMHINVNTHLGMFHSIRSSLHNWVTSWFPSDSDVTVYIKGDLPPVSKQTWVTQRDRQKATPFGIELLGQAQVNIDIKQVDGQFIKNIHTGDLGKGVHEFTWSHEKVIAGDYLIEFTVDGESMQHQIRVGRI